MTTTYYLSFLTHNPLYLYRWNVICATIHWILFIVLFSISMWNINKFGKRNLTTDFSVYDPISKTYTVQSTVISTYSTVWLILFFPIYTALFHTLISQKRFYWKYLYQVTELGVNQWRWIEYCITATPITIVVWAECGATNVMEMIAIIFFNICMNLCGWLQEELNKTKSYSEGEYKTWKSYVKENFSQSYKYMRLFSTHKEIEEYDAYIDQMMAIDDGKLDNDISIIYGQRQFLDIKPTNYLPFITGVFAFIPTWVIIFTYFFVALSKSSVSAPWWVWTIAIGLFFLFANFAILMLAHYIQKDMVTTVHKNYVKISMNKKKWGKQFSTYFADRTNTEAGFALLSAVSKTFLPVFLFIGTFTR